MKRPRRSHSFLVATVPTITVMRTRDESAIDLRIRIARIATTELMTAMRSALAAWR